MRWGIPNASYARSPPSLAAHRLLVPQESRAHADFGSPANASLTTIPVGFGFAAANHILRCYVAATGGAGFPPGITGRPGDDSPGWGVGVTTIRRIVLRLRPLGDWFGPWTSYTSSRDARCAAPTPCTRNSERDVRLARKYGFSEARIPTGCPGWWDPA